MRLIFAITICLSALIAGCDKSPDDSASEGFAAALSQSAQNGDLPFLQPGSDTGIQLPRDLGPHPRYRIEWWYLTANLTTASGQPLGVQWTQFRQSLKARAANAQPPPSQDWPLQSAWMAHAAVSYQDKHVFSEKLARGDIGQADAQADPFKIWLDDWQLAATDNGKSWHLQAHGKNWHYNLTLTPTRQPVRHGDNGFSAKSEDGKGSMYFSYVNLGISGTVTLDDKTHEVSGTGWFDREWSSQFLKTGQQGWDWFALHLDSGAKLMAFRLRGSDKPFQSGTWITPSGQVIPLKPGAITIKPAKDESEERKENQIPKHWEITVPRQRVTLTISSRSGNQWNDGMFPYWEGPVVVKGSHSGVGYMELTGYEKNKP